MKKVFALLISAALIVSAVSAQEASGSEAPADGSAAQEQSAAADQAAAVTERDAVTEKVETTEKPAKADAPGLKFSAGIGGAYTFLHYTYTRVNGKLDLATVNFEDTQWSGSENSGGAFAFFDATYAKVELGYRSSQFGPLYIGVYGKYPFALLPKLTIAPPWALTLSFWDRLTQAPPWA